MSYKAYNRAYGALFKKEATYTPDKGRSCSHAKKNRQESDIQVMLVAWLRNANVPVMAIPNEGRRGISATVRLKRMGLWPGASDLLIARASTQYHGFFVELKRKGEKPRENQVQFLEAMRKEGYRAEWFDDINTARQAITDYLAQGQGNENQCNGKCD